MVKNYKKSCRSKTLALLTSLTRKGFDFNWLSECANSFRKMKIIVAEDTLVSLPEYGKEVVLHIEQSDK